MEKQNRFTIKVPSNKPHYRDAFLLMNLINTAFYKILLQKERIEKDLSENNLKNIFADIHFFLISTSNLKHGLEKLRHVLKEDNDYKIIYKKYIKKLEYLVVFRDHQEHIFEGRLEGKGKGKALLKNPGMLGNIIDDNYDFGGESFNLSETFKLLNDLQEEIIDWNSQKMIYPLWGIA